ncbi:MAG TPA: hypothetical protein VFW95_07850 [Candidatus Limnocylindria bacterium]|nr:hypothetical protein [Candidatus Limnocylindria bacterium]
MSGLAGTDGLVTWIAALVTLVVFGGLLGERRVFGWSQHLLAGLATGLLALLAIRELILPRVLEPLLAEPAARGDLWIGLGLVMTTAAAPWIPRAVAAVPISVLVGSLAAFALGGAVIGTLLPQLAAAAARPEEGAVATVVTAGSAAITVLVLFGFVHGAGRGRLVVGAAATGRWIMLVGLGGWLGYLILSRLVLLLDRLAFLVGDWLGLGA